MRKTTYFVTMRTVQGRFLLTPSDPLNRLLVGTIGRANAHYAGVDLHGVVMMGNHMHLLLTADSATALARWMNFVAGNVARIAGQHHQWDGRFWARRYRATACLDRESVVRMLGYLAAHSAKEGLTVRPEEWPGVHCVDALRFDRPLLGSWLDRTRYNRARRRGQDAQRRRFTTEYAVRLTPPPALSELSAAAFRTLVEQQRRDAIEAGRATRAGQTAVGAKRILRQDPHHAPRASKRTPGPRFHVADAARRNTSCSATGWPSLRTERLSRDSSRVFTPSSFHPTCSRQPRC